MNRKVEKEQEMAMKKFYLDKQNAKFMGVCSGIARTFNIDATLVRIGAVVITLLGGAPWTLIAYGVAAWLASPVSRYGDDAGVSKAAEAYRARHSAEELRRTMSHIDHRMAEVETFVTNSNNSLSSEIEKLR
jgi:phage shock protein C